MYYITTSRKIPPPGSTRQGRASWPASKGMGQNLWIYHILGNQHPLTALAMTRRIPFRFWLKHMGAVKNCLSLFHFRLLREKSRSCWKLRSHFQAEGRSWWPLRAQDGSFPIHGVPLIQVMEKHDLYIETNSDLGIRPWLRKPMYICICIYVYVYM